MKFEELKTAVVQWGQAKNLVKHDQAQVKAQFSKVEEEVEEFKEAINVFFDSTYPTTEDIKLELGDVMVTLILTSACLGIDIEESLTAAYEKIKNRKGKTLNGVFVKDE